MVNFDIVIPAYNESDNIDAACKRLSPVAKEIVEKFEIEQVRIIFVDDGSADGTAAKVNEVKSNYNTNFLKVEVIQFSRNFGHSAAVFAGLEYADAEYIAIIDADMQDPPEILPEMQKTLIENKLDVVYGKRKKRKGEGPFKLFTAWMFYRFINMLSGTKIPTDTGDFRIITKEVRDCLIDLNEPEPFLRGLVAWIGFRQEPFYYERDERKYGESKYPFKKMFRFAILAIVSFSTFPLVLSVYLGLAGVMISLGLSVYALHQCSEKKTVSAPSQLYSDRSP